LVGAAKQYIKEAEKCQVEMERVLSAGDREQEEWPVFAPVPISPDS